MKKRYPEDWHFKIEVLWVDKENHAEEYHLGLEPGDTFESDYEMPGEFCPTGFIKIFPIMEATRCEGNLRYLEANSAHGTVFVCPDGAVRFRVSGIKQE